MKPRYAELTIDEANKEMRPHRALGISDSPYNTYIIVEYLITPDDYDYCTTWRETSSQYAKGLNELRTEGWKTDSVKMDDEGTLHYILRKLREDV